MKKREYDWCVSLDWWKSTAFYIKIVIRKRKESVGFNKEMIGYPLDVQYAV